VDYKQASIQESSAAVLGLAPTKLGLYPPSDLTWEKLPRTMSLAHFANNGALQLLRDFEMAI